MSGGGDGDTAAEDVGHLASAFEYLDTDQNSKNASATDAADAAVKRQRRLKRVCREVASTLLSVDDLREVMSQRELSRRVRGSARP
jgi:hypothetical protein